ncbi:MAG: sigma 54-interacting transcriptional regulator [Alphaproteobacteria bacterium]|nr:sigma 54-interacting transcriptional regulator [Alphaproteobacteria bacterium]
MPPGLLDHLDQAEAALRSGDLSQASLSVALARAALSPLQADLTDARDEVERCHRLLERTSRITAARGLGTVAQEALDAVMETIGARRGLIGKVTADGWTLLVARDLARADVEDPSQSFSTSIIGRVLQSGEPFVAHDAVRELTAESVNRLALRSVVCLPLVVDDRVLGFIYLDHTRARGLFNDAALETLRGWLPTVARSVARADADDGARGLPGVLSRSSTLQASLAELARIARFDASILLTGETGTGKSLIARGVHRASPRAGGPFVHINCGAIPEALIEGELFGSEPGAYTGAQVQRIGRFEAASGGTLFLDELDSMPIACQAKLLVALQERQITRLGSNQPIPVDVRVVAATSRDPAEAIRAGALREDLYYRLAVFVAHLPPLRERPEDVALLARHFLDRTRERYDLPPLHLSPEAEAQLVAHDWPGNVRELENTLDRAALLSTDGQITDMRVRAAPAGPTPSTGGPGALGPLLSAADAVAAALVKRPDLRDLKALGVFRGAVLRALVRRLGSADEAFRLLGLDEQVRARNHQRTLRREVGRLEALATRLGERLDA